MSTASKIEWTSQTWNPVTGRTKISPGCKHCYAETMANRLKATHASGYVNGFELTLYPARLSQPLHRKKPTVYFVNSMSDLFHESIPDAFLEEVFSVIRRMPRHTFQILTNRADRLPLYFSDRACPDNAWIGVSVEDRRYGSPRIEERYRANLYRIDSAGVELNNVSSWSDYQSDACREFQDFCDMLLKVRMQIVILLYNI